MVTLTLGLAATALMIPVIAGTAHADSDLGGQITRSEVISRAQDWNNRNVQYCTYDKTTCANSGTPWTWDIDHTRQYRPDCSGFVDMAWHLNADPNTDGLDDSTYTTSINKADLKSGDILDDIPDGHVVLFAGWYDSAHTEAWIYYEGSTETDMNYSHAPVYSGTLAGHPAANYKAYRYKKIVDDPTTPPPPPPRIGVVNTAGGVSVKEGGLDQIWRDEFGDARQVVVDGDRIAVLGNDGIVHVKQGGLDQQWQQEATGIKQVALAGDRIGVLDNNGAVQVKEGDLNQQWKPEATGVKQIALAGDRIAILTTDGRGVVKAGPLDAGWKDESTGTAQIAVTSNRIGILGTDGAVQVKEGDLDQQWKPEATGIKQISLS
jgi:hypothetical protein